MTATAIETTPASSTAITSNATEEFSKPETAGKDPGLAYLRVPYTMTLEEEKSILEEARRRRTILLEKNSSDEGWYSRMNYKGVSITSSQDADTPFCRTKGVCALPEGMSLEFVRDQLQYDLGETRTLNQFFHRIDPMTQQMAVAARIKNTELLNASEHEELRIIWGSFYVAPLFSDRDFCFVGHTSEIACPITGERIFLSNSYSIEHPAVPEMYDSVGRVRAHIEATGYIVRPLADNPDRLSITYTVQADPKGYVPTKIVNLVSVSQAMNAGRIRDMYQVHMEAAHAMASKAPLERYDVDRRGGKVVHSIPVQKSRNEEETAEDGTFEIHIRAYAEHSISVQLQGLGESSTFKMRCVGDQDSSGSKLLSGKVVTFGGKHHHVLSATFAVSPGEGFAGTEIPHLNLEFVNSGWRKNTLFVPAGIAEVKKASSDTEAISDSEEDDVADQ